MARMAIKRRKHPTAYVLVDDADLEFVRLYGWYITPNGYAVADVDGAALQMGRLLLGITERGLYCDHINGDRLDNRRWNLRAVTPTQNQGNRRPAKNNTSGHRGVTLTKHGTWQAQLHVRGRNVYLGVFPTADDAATAYKHAADTHFGPYLRGEAMSLAQDIEDVLKSVGVRDE